MNQIVAENNKLQCDTVIIKNVNRKFEEKMKKGEKGEIKPQTQHRNIRGTKQDP